MRAQGLCRSSVVAPRFACNHRHPLGGVVTFELRGRVLGTDSARNRGVRAPGGLWAWKRSEDLWGWGGGRQPPRTRYGQGLVGKVADYWEMIAQGAFEDVAIADDSRGAESFAQMAVRVDVIQLVNDSCASGIHERWDQLSCV